MSSPPHPSQFTPYDPLPSSGSRPHSSADLNPFFDQPLPAPHHMSGGYPAAPSLQYRPSMENYQDANPGFLTPGARGGYMSPAAAASATSTAGYGLKEARTSQISMTGLGSTPPARESAWLHNETKHQKRNRTLVVSICLVILVIIGAAIGLGVYFGTKNKNTRVATGQNNNSNSNGTSTNTATSGAVDSDPNDPSVFTKDPALKNSFYGIAYTMMDALYPNCNQNLAQTIEDMQLISQITTRIRLYGADCDQTGLVLEAIKQTKVDVKVFVAIYIVDGDDVSYERQKTALKDALTKYGTDNILGITVGNEFMLNYLQANGAEDPASATGLKASAILKTKITDIRNMIADMNINLPVGTADAGSYFNNDLLGAVDFGMSNVHAWFAGTTIGDSSDWTKNFFQETNVEPANKLSNKPQMYIAETGWPSHSSDKKDETNGAAEASVANLQKFMDDFVCSSNTAGIKYFYFEFTDIPWKDAQFGGVEGFWGLFDSKKKLKALTMPDCSHD